MSLEQGNRKQAVYCWNRLLRLDPSDFVRTASPQATLMLLHRLQCTTAPSHTGTRATRRERWRDFRCACLHSLPRSRRAQALHKQDKTDTNIILELAELFVHSGQQERAASLLEEAVQGTEVDFNVVNVLADLYMGAGEFEKASKLIKRTVKDRPALIDIAVKSGICALYLGNEDQAAEHFRMLLARSPASYGDLFYSVAEAYAAVGNPGTYLHSCVGRSLTLCRQGGAPLRATGAPQYGLQQTRAVVAAGALLPRARPPRRCVPVIRGRYVRTDDLLRSLWCEVLGASPSNVEASLALADLYAQQGHVDRAIEVLKTNLAGALPCYTIYLAVLTDYQRQ